MAPAAPLFGVSIDAGYQSQYFLLGINQVHNSGAFDSNGKPIPYEDDSDVFYGGISAHWNGLGAGVKYIRGTTSYLTRFSDDDNGFTPNRVSATYEEIVATVHYTLAVLPDGMLNVTGAAGREAPG